MCIRDSGMDAVNQIAEVPTGSSGGHGDVPMVEVLIESITIED